MEYESRGIHMQYGIYEIILNIKNLVITKVFYPKARLVRFPCFIRNSKNIFMNNGFTCGYNCRLESVESSGKFGVISFGENVKIGDNVHIASASSVKIGNNVLMASHIFISDLDHGKYNDENDSSKPDSVPDLRPIYSQKIEIGDNVWIGENVVILKGVSIGKGCVIGANSIITKSIPSNCIVIDKGRIIKRYSDKKEVWVREND